MKQINRTSKNKRVGYTIEDVLKATEMHRKDPDKFARSPRFLVTSPTAIEQPGETSME